MTRSTFRTLLPAALLALGCAAESPLTTLEQELPGSDKPGRFRVSFRWRDGRPPIDGNLYVSGRVEERAPDKPPRLLGSAETIAYPAEKQLRFEQIPNGDHRVVVIEMRLTRPATEPVEYYGISAPFGLQPNRSEDDPVDVQVPLVPRPTLAGVRIPAVNAFGYVHTDEVALELRASPAELVRITNRIDDTDGVTLEVPMAGTPGDDGLVPVTIPAVKLMQGVTTCPEPACLAQLTVQVVDAQGYPSAPVTASVLLDTTPPRPATGNDVTPEVANPDGVVAVRLFVSEPLQQTPTLRIAGQPDFTFHRVPDDDRPSTTYHFVADAAVGARLPHDTTFEVRADLMDLAGNETPDVLVDTFRTDLVKPVISDLTAMPATLSRQTGFNLLGVEFSLSEPLTGGQADLVATLAGNPLSCLATDTSNPWGYRCERTLTDEDPEGAHPVRVVVTDDGGNQDAQTTLVELDFTAPVVLDAFPSREDYGAAEAIQYTVNLSEPLLAVRPTVTLLRDGDDATADLGAPAEETDTSFTWRLPASALGTGRYTLTVTGRDKAGNPTAAPTDGMGFAVHARAPVVDIMSPPVRLGPLSAVADRALTATVQPALTGALLEVAVSVDDVVISPVAANDPCSLAGNTLTCTLPVDPDDEGFHVVRIVARDAGGNSAEDEGTYEIDATGPLLTGTVQLSRTDGNPRATPAPDLVHLSRTPYNGGATPALDVVFTLNEALARDPVVTLGTRPALVRRTEPGDPPHLYRYRYTQQPDETDGEETVTVVATDLLDNESTLELGTVRFDNTPPALTPTLLGGMTYRRAPWGRAARTEPHYELTVAGALEPEATLMVLDTASLTTGAVLATSSADASGALSGPIALPARDRARVHVVLADRAGNLASSDDGTPATAAALVPNVEWVATLGGKVPGSTTENPHRALVSHWVSDGARQPTVFTREAPTPEALADEGDATMQVATGPDDAWVAHVRNPAVRIPPALSHDVDRGVTVLFGGGATAETWEWNGAQWNRITPTDPEADGNPRELAYPALAYDEVNDETVLFGGSYAVAGPGLDCGNNTLSDDDGLCYSDETWTWNGTSWRLAGPGSATCGARPVGRDGAAMAFDRNRQRVVMVGGYRGAPGDCPELGEGTPSNLSELWAWDGAAWTTVTTSETPPGRFLHALAYDDANSALVLFGGKCHSAFPACDFASDNCSGTSCALADTWILDDQGWTNAQPTGAPLARFQHGLAFSPADTAVLLYGGTHVTTGGVVEARVDTWRWSGDAWTPVTPTDPEVDGSPMVSTAPLVTDAARNRVTLFFSETWEWSGASWARQAPARETSPGKYAFALTSDPVHRRVVLFGGENTTNNHETWAWDGAGWELALVGDPDGEDAPSGRIGPAMTWDRTRNVVLLHGGLNTRLCGAAGQCQDTWTLDGETWTRVSQSAFDDNDNGAGDPVVEFALADDGHGRVIMFGGRDVVTGAPPRASTGAWDGTAWTKLTPASSPGARARAAMAYDAARDRVVLFGGWHHRDALGSCPTGSNDDDVPLECFFSDTWEWNGETGTWTRRFPANAPSARMNHAMAYDESTGRVLLFGGVAPPCRLNDLGRCTTLGDVWEWTGTDWAPRLPAAAVPDGLQDGDAPPLATPGLAYDHARAGLVLHGYPDTTIVHQTAGTARRAATVLEIDVAAGAIEAAAVTRVSLLARASAVGGGVGGASLEVHGPEEFAWSTADDSDDSSQQELTAVFEGSDARALLDDATVLRARLTSVEGNGAVPGSSAVTVDYFEAVVNYTASSP